MTEYRRILLEGAAVQVRREGDELVSADGRVVGVDEAIHLPPVVPTKIVAVHLNHVSRVNEFQIGLPTTPTYFHKPVSSLNSHRGSVVRPERCKWLNYEGEVAIVIGRTARNISPEEAGDYVAGYTVANDYAIRDYLENYYRPNLRVKNRDGCTVLGPWFVPAADVLDPHNLALRTLVNGVETQHGHTADLISDIPALIEYLSGFMTLQPGDVILTGTPDGVVNVNAGDEVVTEIDGIGRLVNTLVGDEIFNIE